MDTSPSDQKIENREFSLTSTFSKQGCLDKKMGRSKYTSMWFDIDETCEFVNYYTDNPRLGHMRSNFIDYINLTGSKVKIEEKKNRNVISIVEKSGTKTNLAAHSTEERDGWIDFVNRTKSMCEVNAKLIQTSSNMISNGSPSNSDGDIVPITLDETDTTKQTISAFVEPIEEFDSIWSYVIQDEDKKLWTLGDVLGDSVSVVLVLRHFGMICRQFITQRFLSVQHEFANMGVPFIIVVHGPAALIKQVFIKENRIPAGTQVYSDPRCMLLYTLNDRFGSPHDISQQLYSVFALHKKGKIFYGFSENVYMDNHVDTHELRKCLRNFFTFNSNLYWSHVKQSTLRYNMLNDVDSQPKNIVYLPESNYGYEFGTKKPPLTSFTSSNQTLLYHETVLKDDFSKKDLLWIVGEDDEGTMFVICVPPESTVQQQLQISPFEFVKCIIVNKSGFVKVSMPVECYSDVAKFSRWLTSTLQLKVQEKLKLNLLEESVLEELLEIENNFHFQKYKIGVLYGRTKHIAEDEMYNNCQMSSDFEDFLKWMGTKVELKGWPQFRGGLDVRGTNLTGTHSYYHHFKDQEIMFHVANLMPNLSHDPSRKRHVGNDVIVVVFKDTNDEQFDPHVIKSRFNHIFAVVEKTSLPDGSPAYRIEFAQKPEVPPFPPFLPYPPVFAINDQSKEFFLTKLINGERTAINNVPAFRNNTHAVFDNFISRLPQKAQSTLRFPLVFFKKKSSDTLKKKNLSSLSSVSTPNIVPSQTIIKLQENSTHSSHTTEGSQNISITFTHHNLTNNQSISTSVLPETSFHSKKLSTSGNYNSYLDRCYWSTKRYCTSRI
eukprot:TRINITY_DN3705_c0_g1_i3.p1 TRINITY_DN3705_c0_g1~~TRINITY_DN3705_c0_g1_i3.p1  ORF type:complete len:829 (-),score=128.90 TRINITY_DN3705_c0_g1_i3:146-2632(-)